MAGPLEGFTIIDLCRTRPGQMTTGLLADYGADVVTVVEPGYAQRRASGQGADPARWMVNMRNKRSLNLNLRASGAHEVFFRLAKAADAVLESNRPGVVTRLGVDYEAVKKVNPGIIYCFLSGFGQDGPYAGRAAHDLSYQGISGMLPQDQDGVPFVPAYNQADINASWFGAMAILMALVSRGKSGRGQYIDVAFCDVSVTIPPGGLDDWSLRGGHPAYNVYRTQDGRYLTLSIREPWFWERFCRLIGKEEWIPHENPEGSLRDEMFAYIRDLVAQRTLDEWLEALEENDQQFGPVNASIEEVARDPHLRARNMVLEVDHPVTGKKRYEAGFGMKFSRTPAELRRGPTLMGSDTGDILTELGYDSDAIESLKAGGVVA